MAGASNRRDFLRVLAGETARRAKDLAPLSASVKRLGHAPPIATADPALTRTQPAETPVRTATLDAMLTIAEDLGLGRRSDALRQLARTSTRLAPGPPGAGCQCFAGGTPSLAPGIDRPRRPGRELRLLVSLDCARIAAVNAGLPPAGR